MVACRSIQITETNETVPQNVVGFQNYLGYESKISTGGNPQKRSTSTLIGLGQLPILRPK